MEYWRERKRWSGWYFWIEKSSLSGCYEEVCTMTPEQIEACLKLPPYYIKG